MPVAHPLINEVRAGKIICTRCEQWKTPEEFSPASRMSRKRHSWCRLCRAKWDQERRANPSFREAHNRRRRESGRDRASRQRRLAKDPEAEKWAVIRYKYGISKEQYFELLEAQSGVCANPMCDRPATHIDHDHSCCPSKAKGCGKCVRGLLCKGCNWALGHLGDDVDRLRGLIVYLRSPALKDVLGQ